MERQAMVEPKKKRQSKTWWGILAGVAGLLGLAAGVEQDPSFLADGFQVSEDLEQAVSFVLAVGGWALKNWGLRTAERPVR